MAANHACEIERSWETQELLITRFHETLILALTKINLFSESFTISVFREVCTIFSHGNKTKNKSKNNPKALLMCTPTFVLTLEKLLVLSL